MQTSGQKTADHTINFRRNSVEGLKGISSIKAVLDAMPYLNWHLLETGEGATAYAKLNGDRDAGDWLILIAMENSVAPRHEHLGTPDEEGEMVWTIAGELHDNTDEGEPIVLKPGNVLRHAGGSVHAPYAPMFWLGMYRQPKGNRLVAPSATA